MVPYIATSTTLTLIIGLRPLVIPSTHPNFAKLTELVQLPDTTEADLKPLADIPTAISAFTGDEIKVFGGKLFYRGSEVTGNLADLILGFVKSGDHAAAVPFQKFLANCRQNPDLALVSTIYDWCVKSNLPITPDGELIAWKIVQNDYYSKHAGKRGKLRHQIGDVVTEPREECNPNRDQTCSTGIHFCSMEYLEKGNYGSFGSSDRIIAVVINPADITAIPTDYNLSKGRCCKLTVVGEVPNVRDTVSSFYNDKGRVYGGWSAQPAAVADVPKALHTRFPVKVGDVWRTADGHVVTITKLGVDETKKAWAGFCAYGNGHPTRSAWWSNSGYTSDRPRGEELVELISEAKPEVEKSKALNLKVGDTVKCRNGSVYTIVKASSDGIVRLGSTAKYIFARTGLNNVEKAGCDVTRPMPTDVVEVISRAPVNPANAYGFAVGQKRSRRNGSTVTIVSINGANIDYPIKDDLGNVYTPNGRYNDANSVSQFDLQRLV